MFNRLFNHFKITQLAIQFTVALIIRLKYSFNIYGFPLPSQLKDLPFSRVFFQQFFLGHVILIQVD